MHKVRFVHREDYARWSRYEIRCHVVTNHRPAYGTGMSRQEHDGVCVSEKKTRQGKCNHENYVSRDTGSDTDIFRQRYKDDKLNRQSVMVFQSELKMYNVASMPAMSHFKECVCTI